MITNDALERRLAAHYAAEAPRRAPDRVLRAALTAIDAIPQRRARVRRPWTFPVASRSAKLAMAAAVVVGVLAVVGAGLLVPEPNPTPLPSNATPSPETSPETTPGPESSRPFLSTVPLFEDWPQPVRPEPAGAAPNLPLVVGDDSRWDPTEGRYGGFEHGDPLGDVGPDLAWLDVTEVRLSAGGSGFGLKLAADPPRATADPAGRRIAYGVVLDTDGDGTADVRLGTERIAGNHDRAWRTDLASGLTHASAAYGKRAVLSASGDRIRLETTFPGTSGGWFRDSNYANLSYALQAGEEDFRFYAWAALIDGDRLVATDFAPDAGWLQPGLQSESVTLDGPTWLRPILDQSGEEAYQLTQTMSFTADGTISFDTGCHTGHGTVTVEPGRFRVSDLVVMEVACPSRAARWDAQVMAVLAAGEIAYEIDNGLLRLRAGQEDIGFKSDYEGRSGPSG